MKSTTAELPQIVTTTNRIKWEEMEQSSDHGDCWAIMFVYPSGDVSCCASALTREFAMDLAAGLTKFPLVGIAKSDGGRVDLNTFETTSKQ
jgi:hypothetical protein